MNKELAEYLAAHDFDENETEMLEKWADSGRSVYENPLHEYDDYGREVPFMKWHRHEQPEHPYNKRKIMLREAMRTTVKFGSHGEEMRFLKNSQHTLIDEILMYRRFLARYPGAVEAFEQYRSQETGE